MSETKASSSTETESAENAAYRADARTWLDAHAERKTGVDDWSTQRHHTDAAALRSYFERCREWQRTLYDGGYAGISWPAEQGGQGRTSTEARIFNEEVAAFDVTSGFLSSTIMMIGTALRFHGTPAQQQHFLPRLLSGEDAWCQLFSEPGAGSDLAGLACKAVRDGDEFVLNGQKVWNSMAQCADWGFIIARTDPDVPKHAGITFLLVDMTAPGIEVRPLVQANGGQHFNEVFLNDVRVPADLVVGEVGGGWGPTRTVMAAESQFIGGTTDRSAAEKLSEIATRLGRNTDHIVRQLLATIYSREHIISWMSASMMGAVRRGEAPPVSGGVLKLFMAENRVQIGHAATLLLGPAATAATDPDSEWAQLELINRFSVSIGGGTNEVQRNNVGERDLGLPRDIRVDKDVPWKDVPRG